MRMWNSSDPVAGRLLDLSLAASPPHDAKHLIKGGFVRLLAAEFQNLRLA